ncbi:MAG TPA: PIG-L family deacetylase [Firmicutes bacterium]|nr:PIG-L family deacetylase [Bacillota bacterium]
MKPHFCSILPVPDLLKVKELLVVQPHPDDMEIGAGATIARLIESGTRVTCLTVTDGSVGTTDAAVSQDDLSVIRRSETERSADIIGIENLIWLDFADGGILPLEIIRSEMTGFIRRLKPEAVMVCDPWLPYEAHSDHVRTGLAAAEAVLLAHMPHFCPADLQDGLSPHAVEMIIFYYTAYPNTFIDVTATWDKKIAAIDCHASQFPAGQGDKLKQYLRAKAQEQAQDQDGELVEALKVLSPGHLHIFEHAWQC